MIILKDRKPFIKMNLHLNYNSANTMLMCLLYKNITIMRNLTFRILFLKYSLLFLLIGASSASLWSQDDIACLNHINFSLDPQTCSGSVTPTMLLVGTETCTEDFEITITDEHDDVVPNAFTRDDIGRDFTYMVCCEDNCCWGTMTVEYKSTASIVCPADDTIQCGTLDFYTFVPPTSACSSLAVTIIGDEKSSLECDTLLTATVHRTYKVEDDFGNTTKCHQNIGLERINTSDIIWPRATTVSCSDSNLVFNDEGVPLPWFYQNVTGSGSGSGSGLGIGVPIICGVTAPFDFYFPEMDVEPITNNTYGTTVTYPNGNTGNGVNGGGGSMNAVAGSSFFCTGTGSGTGAYPLIPSGGATIIVETGDQNDPDVNSIFVQDESTALFCNTLITYTDFAYPVSPGSCTRKIARTWELQEWWCTDELTISSLQVIEIRDDQAPEYVCPADFTVSTTDDCAAKITLPKLNPVDICGGDVIVKTQYSGGLIDGDGAIVDLNIGPNPVTYTVSDGCLNSSICQTMVTVVDGTDPVAICEQTKVVALSTLNDNRVPAAVFDDASFDDCGIVTMEARRMDATCYEGDIEWSEYVRFCCADVNSGEVMVAFRVLDLSGNQSVCMVRVEVQDKLVADLTCPVDRTIDCSQGYDINNLGLTFGIPQFSGTCGNIQIPEESLITDVNECGIGLLKRTFKASDAQGNVLNSCTQTITVENASPFVGANIQWPGDYEQNNGCSIDALHPDQLPLAFGYPQIFGGNGCNKIGYDFIDKVFDPNPGSFECVVIERTWTVVNWCSAINGQFETFTIPEPQLIKLRNTVAPELATDMNVVFDTDNTNCESGDVIISRSAVDDCNNNLFWSYTLTSRNTGVIVAQGNTSFIEGNFATGLYDAAWTVSDGCGNSDSDVQVVNIFSSKTPTPVCHNGLSGSLVGADSNGDGQIDLEQIELWASDFDAGSYPNCNNPITFSFSADTTNKVVFFDCNHLGIQEVDLWVTDVYTGAQANCISFIDIQDSNGLCEGFTVAVAGEIQTEEAQSIEGVEVLLDNTTLNDMTDEDGLYAFRNMPLGGDYRVMPQLDTDYLNGVSTIDLIIIQRHILGIAPLDSPYKLIAADVNNSESINGIDLVELRKLILGIYTDLPMNTSWRFVAEEHEFADPRDPWLMPLWEAYNITNILEDQNLNFIGVKIGDVNSDASASLFNSNVSNRHSENLEFVMSAESIPAGETSVIEVTAENYVDILGWQGTLEFDSERLEILNIVGEGIRITDENFNMSKASEGYISVSYDSEENTSMKIDEVLFKVIVKAKAELSGKASALSFGSSLTRAEAYSTSLTKLNVNTNSKEAGQLEILSVSPNPFMHVAELEFNMPREDEALFQYYDVNGRLLKTDRGYYGAGTHKLQLRREEFNSNGFVYIRMTTGDASTEYRMILL